MDKNLIGGPAREAFETSGPFKIQHAKINEGYLIKFFIVIALLTSQFGKDLSIEEYIYRSINNVDQPKH